MSSIEDIVVTVTIDAECDYDPNWIRSKPLTFRSIQEGLPERLQPAFAEVGAVPTYLLTVEVLEDDACVQTLRSLQGDFELGTHLHAAFIEPQKKFFDYAGVDSPDFQCSYPPDIEYQKLKNLTMLFENQLGYAPRSFRAGRYGLSSQSLRSLQRLGYRVDTSITPHIRWTEPNATVDFRKAPQQPYYPSDEHIDRPGAASESTMFEVPVTVKPRFMRNPLWFRPWFSTVDQMKDIFRYHVKKHSNQRVLSINMMFHSMEIIEKASPYPQNLSEVQYFIEQMQEALQWCEQEGARFVSLNGVRDAFQTSTDLSR